MPAGTLIHPGRHPGRGFRFPRRRRAYATAAATPAPAPAVPAVGATGSAAFVLSLEPGAKVTYSWSTSLSSSYSGIEQRESLQADPSIRFEGAAFLLDGGMRDVTGRLMKSAASGATFLLGLPFEELSISADSTGVVVTVASTARADWALPGQRCVVLGVNGTSTAAAIVQSATDTTITLALVDSTGALIVGGTLGTTGARGGRIMPLIAVLLEPSQGFARYPVTVGLWSLRAKASAFGWAGVSSMGIGTSITTMSDQVPIAVANLADGDVLIWDRINAIDGTAAETMISRTELVDLGALPFAIGGADASTWGRSIKFSGNSGDDWQWIKAFVSRLRGQQGAFFLSTGRPDIIAVSTLDGGIKVASSSVSGAGDYASWFVSQAHRRLALVVAGATVYVTVSAVVDNGDGTLTLSLDNAPLVTPTKISMLEQVRLASDDVEVTWDGGVFSCELGVVTVPDVNVIVASSPFMFETLIDGPILPPISGTMELNAIGIPPDRFPIVLGNTSVVSMFDLRRAEIGAISSGGGNVDGMLLMLPNPIPSNQSIELIQEWSGASSAASRILFSAATAAEGWSGEGGILLVYCGAISRWIVIGKAP